MSLGVLLLFALVLTACGGDSGVGVDPDEPVIQIRYEGGFVPMEMAMNTGPTYTILGDGRLIYPGAITMQYPGPLYVPNWVAQLGESQMTAVLAMVNRIGVPDIVDETDDSAMNVVADASTTVITFWDEEGEHRYAVYALGFEESPSAENQAFSELVETLGQFTAEAPSEPYEPEQVRIIAGPANIDPAFVDTRPWPLDDDDLSTWSETPNGWHCKDFDASVLDSLGAANQATTWEHPDGTSDPLTFLVRQLHPGEADCL